MRYARHMRPLGILAGMLIAGTVAAQPAPAQPGPDYARAKELYKAAEVAAAAGRFDEAARGYGDVFDLTFELKNFPPLNRKGHVAVFKSEADIETTP